jgi:hemerythrin superfamily protein
MTQATHAATDQDVVELLTTDHEEMVELVGRIEGSSDPRHRRDLADTLIAEVMRHAVAEEMYVYPVVEKRVPNGAEQVEHDKKEHAEIVRVMKEIEDADASSALFKDRVGVLGAMLRHHARDEEEDQFPQLRAHLTRGELVEMGAKVEAAKRLAPTRPHPHTPHSELFHKTVGLGVGLIDRLRDRLTGRHTGQG